MEQASAAPATPASGGDSSSSNAGQTKGQTSPQGNVSKQSAKNDTSTAPNENGEQSQATGDDDQEDLQIGSYKGRVSKKLAAELKNLERGVQKKFQEVAQMKKAAQQDPAGFLKWAGVKGEDSKQVKAVLKGLGIDPEEFAESTLAEKLELMSLTPEQVEAMQAKEELKKYKDKEKTQAEREKAEKESLEERTHTEKLHKEFISEWRESGLPPKPVFGTFIAAQLLRREKQNELRKQNGEEPLPDLTMKEAAAKVKSEFKANVGDVLKDMDPQGILDLIGPETMNKIREFDIQRVSGKASPGNQPPQKRTVNSVSGEQSKNKQSMSEAEFREWNKNFINSLKD